MPYAHKGRLRQATLDLCEVLHIPHGAKGASREALMPIGRALFAAGYEKGVAWFSPRLAAELWASAPLGQYELIIAHAKREEPIPRVQECRPVADHEETPAWRRREHAVEIYLGENRHRRSIPGV